VVRRRLGTVAAAAIAISVFPAGVAASARVVAASNAVTSRTLPGPSGYVRELLLAASQRANEPCLVVGVAVRVVVDLDDPDPAVRPLLTCQRGEPCFSKAEIRVNPSRHYFPEGAEELRG
jgi:hypothetical protein